MLDLPMSVSIEYQLTLSSMSSLENTVRLLKHNLIGTSSIVFFGSFSLTKPPTCPHDIITLELTLMRWRTQNVSMAPRSRFPSIAILAMLHRLRLDDCILLSDTTCIALRSCCISGAFLSPGILCVHSFSLLSFHTRFSVCYHPCMVYYFIPFHFSCFWRTA